MRNYIQFPVLEGRWSPLLRVLAATDRKRVRLGVHEKKRRLIVEVKVGIAFGHSSTLNVEKTLEYSWLGA
jgi:hypothetical protein